MLPIFVNTAETKIPVHLIQSSDWESVAKSLDPALRLFAEAQKFEASAGQTVMMPTEEGAMGAVLFGLGKANNTADHRIALWQASRIRLRDRRCSRKLARRLDSCRLGGWGVSV